LVQFVLLTSALYTVDSFSALCSKTVRSIALIMRVSKHNNIGITKATRASEDPWDSFEDKDLYTTSEIVKAITIIVSRNIGISTILSLPVPLQSKPLKLDPGFRLGFFLYRLGGSYPDGYLQPPFCKVLSANHTYRQIQFLDSTPKDFNLDILSQASLGCLSDVRRRRPYRGEEPDIDNFDSWITQLYTVVDKLLKIYPYEPNLLTDDENSSVRTYLELFSSFIEPPFLRVYQSINPHFFDWIEIASGQKIAPLLINNDT
jgi:hypothetical protein